MPESYASAWFNGFFMDNKGPTFNLVMAWILFLTLGLPKFTDYGHVKQCSISPP